MNEPKPVAWMHCLPDGHNVVSTTDESAFVDDFTGTYKTIPLYTEPPDVAYWREAYHKMKDEVERLSLDLGVKEKFFNQGEVK